MLRVLNASRASKHPGQTLSTRTLSVSHNSEFAAGNVSDHLVTHPPTIVHHCDRPTACLDLRRLRASLKESLTNVSLDGTLQYLYTSHVSQAEFHQGGDGKSLDRISFDCMANPTAACGAKLSPAISTSLMNT